MLTDELIAQITCPVLVAGPNNMQSWPGRSKELFDKLNGTKAIVAFTEAGEADSHCEPAASGIRGERIFGWLAVSRGGHGQTGRLAALEDFPNAAELAAKAADVKAELGQKVGVLAVLGVYLVRELLAGLLSLVVVAPGSPAA